MRQTFRNLLAASAAAAACCAATLESPRIGYVFLPDSGTVETIRGIPGAAARETGPEAAGWSRAFLSSRAGLGIGIGSSGEVVLLRLGSDAVSPLDAPPSPAAVELSPSGTAAVFLYADRVRVLADLAGGGRVSFERTLDAAPAALAVSDDGSEVLAVWNGRPTRLTAEGVREASGIDGVSAVAYRAASLDALAAGDGQLARLRADGSIDWLATGDQELRGDLLASALGRDAAVAARRGGAEVKVFTGGAAVSAACACQVSALEPMERDGVFRLNTPGPGPLMLLETSGTAARTVFVAPRVEAGEGR